MPINMDLQARIERGEIPATTQEQQPNHDCGCRVGANGLIGYCDVHALAYDYKDRFEIAVASTDELLNALKAVAPLLPNDTQEKVYSLIEKTDAVLAEVQDGN